MRDDDSDHETASTVTAALQSSSDYVFGRYWTTSVSVTDNDPLLSVRAVGAPPAGQTHPVATEGATFEFVVSRTMTNPNANLRPLTVDWEVVEQPAGGYLPAGVSGVSQQATFAPGETELTVEVPTVDDAVHEGGSAFAPLGHVTFRLLSGDYKGGRTAVHLIEDDDVPPRIAIWHHRGRTVHEGDGARFGICRHPVSGSDLSSNTDDLAIDLTVTAEGDLVEVPLPTTMTIRSGQNCRYLVVPTDDDKSNEDDGSLTVTLLENGTDDYTIDPVNYTKTKEILDNDYPALIFMVSYPLVMTEGVPKAYSICRTSPASVPVGQVVLLEDLDVDLAFDDEGSAETITWNFAAGFEGCAVPTLTTNDDAVTEPDGSATLTLPESATGEYVLDSRNSITWTVVDDDIPPKVRFANISSARVLTEGDSFSFNVKRVIADSETELNLDTTLDVSWRVSPVGLASLDDFFDSGALPREVTFPPGSDTVRVTVQSENDSVDEDRARIIVVLNLEDGADYDLDSQGVKTFSVSIADNDTTVRIEPGPGASTIPTSVREGDAPSFTIRRLNDETLSEEIVVGLTVEQEGDFLSHSPPQRVTIRPNELSAVVVLATEDDAVPENAGRITLSIDEDQATSGAGYAVHPGNKAQVSFEVRDNETIQQVSVTPIVASVSEGEFAKFLLERVGPIDLIPDVALSFQIIATGTPFTNIMVYSAYSEGKLIAHNYRVGSVANITQSLFRDSNTQVRLELETLDDNVDEADGAYTVQIKNSFDGDYLIGSPGEATVIVRDNEATAVGIRSDQSRVTEGSDVSWTLWRTEAVDSPLTVGVDFSGLPKIMTQATKDVVAISALENRPDMTVVFEPGDLTRTVRLSTEADDVNEGDGYIRAQLCDWSRVSHLSGFDHEYTNLIGGFVPRPRVHVVDDDIPELTIESLSVSSTLVGSTLRGEIVEGSEVLVRVACNGAAGSEQFWTATERRMNHPVNGYNGDWSHVVDCGSDLSIFPRHGGWTGPDNGTFTHEVLSSSQSVERLLDVNALFDPLYFEPSTGCSRSDMRYCRQWTTGSPSSVHLDVINRDPTITIEPRAPSVNEGDVAGFVLRRIWNPSNLLDSTDSGASITTVSLRATAAGGYVAEEALDAVQTIVFDVGVTEVLVEFPTLDDLVQGGGGLVTVELLEDSADVRDLRPVEWGEHAHRHREYSGQRCRDGRPDDRARDRGRGRRRRDHHGDGGARRRGPRRGDRGDGVGRGRDGRGGGLRCRHGVHRHHTGGGPERDRQFRSDSGRRRGGRGERDAAGVGPRPRSGGHPGVPGDRGR